jgi:ferritin-like metal-binding protein YciE
MAVQNADEMLLTMLSNIHHREKQIAQFWDQLSQQAQEPDVKNALSVRSYLTLQDAANIEKCFQLLGKPMPPPDTRFAQTMLEDFRREYDGLATIAELTGNWAVAGLLEHNLADKVDFIEHTREWFRDAVRQAIGARVAGRAA